MSKNDVTQISSGNQIDQSFKKELNTTENVAVGLRASNICMKYETSNKIILHNLSLDVRPGEFAAFLGPSGCGKTTMLSILAGLAKQTSGEVEYYAYNDAQEHAILNPTFGMVFQEHRLLPWKTIRENIGLALTAIGIREFEQNDRINKCLEALQILEYADTWPSAMSGGQRQRASIARALSIRPNIIFMDEPFSALDELTARVLRSELSKLWKETNATILFVTHSIKEACFLADRIFVFKSNPGQLYRTIDVNIPRPREFDGRSMIELERSTVEELLGLWGGI